MKNKKRWSSFLMAMLVVMLTILPTQVAFAWEPQGATGGTGAPVTGTNITDPAAPASGGTTAANGTFHFGFSADPNGTITINTGTWGSIGGNDWKSGLGGIVTKYKVIAQVILGFCVVTSLIIFILSITKLSASGIDSMPMARRKAMTSILISGIALALFGGLSIVVGFFWNFLTLPV